MNGRYLESYIADESRYKLIKEIGTGSNGVVYLAEDLLNGEKCAFKRLRYYLESNRELTLFVREVEAMASIAHPAILKLRSFSLGIPAEKSLPFISTEYAEHNSLDDYLKKVRKNNSLVKWDEKVRFKIIYGIAAAMCHIHRKGLLHRDLKPGNILISADSVPKIGDFGGSRPYYGHNVLEQSEKVGSPIWTPPEIFKNESYDHSIDVYAYGLILYQIFTLKLPFENVQHIQDLENKVLNGIRPLITDDIPPFYQKVISDCWNEDKNKRPSFKSLMASFKTAECLRDLIKDRNIQEYISVMDSATFSSSLLPKNITKMAKKSTKRTNQSNEDKGEEYWRTQFVVLFVVCLIIAVIRLLV